MKGEKRARKIAAQSSFLSLVDGILYYVDSKQGNRKRAVVPEQLRTQVMEENHRKSMGGHFSGNRMFNELVRHWWWDGMYGDTQKYARNCPECAIVTGGGRLHRPPLHPIPVRRPFQILGVDIMDLPKTTNGNKHVTVFHQVAHGLPIA